MGTVTFERPSGAPGDVKELEFVMALLLTSPRGTYDKDPIRPIDIMQYLLSRHGVVVPEDVIKKLIVNDMAGQTCDFEDDPVMDLCQLAAILLIPNILQAATDRSLGNRMFASIFDEIRFFAKDGDQNEKACLKRDVLRKIFGQLDEFHLSDQLLDEMVREAGESASFVQALTVDIQAFDAAWIDRNTTNWQDVALMESDGSLTSGGKPSAALESNMCDLSESCKGEASSVPEEAKGAHRELYPLKHSYTMSSIDYVAGTYRRPCFVMILWVCCVTTYFSYVFYSGQGHWAVVDCDHLTKIGCMTVQGIVKWLAILVQLSTLGFLFILLGSFGSSVYVENKYLNILSLTVAMAAIFVATFLTFFGDFKTAWFDTTGNNAETQMNQSNFTTIYQAPGFILSLAFGCMLLMYQFVDIVFILVPKAWLAGKWCLASCITPGTIKWEARLKRAAARKTERMIDNALSLHEGSGSATDSLRTEFFAVGSTTRKSTVFLAMKNYQTTDPPAEVIGGITWAWRRLFTGRLFDEEGVWIHSRLLASNLVQFAIVAYVVIFTMVAFQFGALMYSNVDWGEILKGTSGDDDSSSTGTLETAAPFSSSTAMVEGSLPPSSISGLKNLDDLLTGATHATATPTQGNSTDFGLTTEGSMMIMLMVLVPQLGVTQFDYRLSITLAFFAGLAASGYVSVILIPSYVSTVLRFRGGMLGSLGDREFLSYRNSPDVVTVLFGSAFWGTLVTTCLTWAFVFILMITITIDWGAKLKITIFGMAAGFIVIMVFKTIVMMVLRFNFCTAFYRKQPAGYNIWMVVLECWNLGLSAGFIAIRAIKLVLISVCFIARLDTPFLAPGVGRIHTTELDAYPQAFRKDLLLQEAHHHPYIERLGLLCLLKLRCGSGFARRPNACWRLLYVLTLMPWLQRYRTRTDILPDELQDKIKEAEEEMRAADDATKLEALRRKTEGMKNLLQSLRRMQESQNEGQMERENKNLRCENEDLRLRLERMEEELAALRRREQHPWNIFSFVA